MDIISLIISIIFVGVLIYLFCKYISIQKFLRKCRRFIEIYDNDNIDNNYINETDSDIDNNIDNNYSENNYINKNDFEDNKYKNITNMIKDVVGFNNDNKKYISADGIFNYRNFFTSSNEGIIRTIINSLTGLGLLGTFIGLSIAISNIDFTNISMDNNIINNITSNVLQASGSAIVTSIYGVISSIILSFILSLFIYFIKDKCNKLAIQLKTKYRETDELYNWDMFYHYQAEVYTDGVNKIVTNFLTKMNKSLKEDLDGYQKSLEESTSSLKEQNKNIIESLTEIKGIKDSLEKWTNTVNNKVDENTNKFEKLYEEYEKTSEKAKLNIEQHIKKVDEIYLQFANKRSDLLNNYEEISNNIIHNTLDVMEKIQYMNNTANNYSEQDSSNNEPIITNAGDENYNTNIDLYKTIDNNNIDETDMDKFNLI